MRLMEMNLPEMTFSGAVLIVVTVLVRTVFLYRLPKKTFLALWGIVLFRLLIPVSISSGFSVYSFVSERKETLDAQIFQREPSAAEKTGQDAPTTEEFGQRTSMVEAPGQNPGKALVFVRYVLKRWRMVWAAGCVMCSCVFLVLYARCRQKFAESLPVEQEAAVRWAAKHRIRRPIQIRQSDRIKVPLTYGLFQPVILMPKCTDWENERQLAYIFAHEYIHIRRLDIVTKLLLAAAVSVHWFNPFVWILYSLCNRDLELSCDETVIHEVEQGSRSEYAHILISMEEGKCIHAPLCSSFRKNAVEERITAIMKNKKVTIMTGILAVSLVAGISASFATSATATDKRDTVRPVTGSALERNSEDGDVSKTESPSLVTGNVVESSSESGDAVEQEAPYLISQDEKFADYKKYGLSYDKKSGYLMYKGKKVGYFKDEWSEQTYTRFSDPTGEIGVIVMRDKDYKITGLQEAEIPYIIEEKESIVELFADDSQVQETVNGEAYAASESASEEFDQTVQLQQYAVGGENADTTETGEAGGVPAEYDQYGIRSDDKNLEWMYKGRKIAALYDADHHVYTTESSPKEHVVYLEILRGTDNKIQEVREITKEEMQKLFDDNMRFEGDDTSMNEAV